MLNAEIGGLNRTIGEGQKQAVATISHLTDKVSELQTKVETADLHKQVEDLKQELINNQKAMAPPPRATLQLDLSDNMPSSLFTPTLVSSRIVKDGRFSLSFDVINATDSDAIDGFLVLIICDACRFASEPTGWKKIDGGLETRRNFDFQRYLSKTASQTFSVEIIPPVGASNVTVGIDYRCKTCKSIGVQLATVNLKAE